MLVFLSAMPASTKTLPLLVSHIFPLRVACSVINASFLLLRPCCDSEADVRMPPNVLLNFNPVVGDWFGLPAPPSRYTSKSHTHTHVQICLLMLQYI